MDIGTTAEQTPLRAGGGIDEDIPFLPGGELVVTQDKAVGTGLHRGELSAADDGQRGFTHVKGRIAGCEDEP